MGLLGPEGETRPPIQQLKCLLVEHGLLGSHCTVPRQNPKLKGLLVMLGLLLPRADGMTCHVGATVVIVVGEVWPFGIAKHSVTTTSVPRERVQQRTAEHVEDAPQAPEETVEAVTLVPRERLKQLTDMAVSFGGAGPWWPRAMGRPADFARPPGIAKKSATLRYRSVLW